jgi:hypothetical protein
MVGASERAALSDVKQAADTSTPETMPGTDQTRRFDMLRRAAEHRVMAETLESFPAE